ncbi:hypothetical protein VH96_06140 [Acinetobacter indicus]|uniref:hypothetical protein n=1 Tax=Acinetobacter indicus TaxID=756892 RepID=UPI0005F8335D|nr:hypothetical protein [Acinetobacter indicus]KJV44659.1 hypothetical protein VH96_06140 [Acinetobacter indicus]
MIKLQVANFIIGELHKELPFDLVLNQAETEAFLTFIEGYKGDLRLPMTCKNESTIIQINKENVDAIYLMLSTHTEQHELPETVVQSLKEVS